MKKAPFTIVVKNLDSWWAAMCPELCVSGFGPTQEKAIECLKVSMRSKLLAQASSLQKKAQFNQLTALQYA